MSRPSDDDIREEQGHHIESRADLNQSQGLPPEEARAAATRAFGNRGLVFEETRAINVPRWLDMIRQDIHYALRTFARSPAVPIAAIVVLALGVGSTTAVFSVVDRLLFRSLPYPEGQKLVSFGLVAPIEPTEFMLGPDYATWRRSQTPFAAITSWSGTTDCDLTEGQATRLLCAGVEATMLPTLGIEPALGRNFTAEEDRPEAPRAVLLSHALWQSRYGSDPTIVDRTISLDGQLARVVGVLPPEFELPTLNRFDILHPQRLRGSPSGRGNMEVVRAFARLQPDVSIAQAQLQLDPLFQESLKNVPPAFRKEVRLRIQPLRDRQVGDARSASWLLLAAVAAVLLIACANVANLLLSWTVARRGELAVRAVLGASRLRLAGQTLTQSLAVGALGGLAGLGLAWCLIRIFVAFAPIGIPRLAQASIDGRVLVFAVVVSLVAALTASTAPTLTTPKAEALMALRYRNVGGRNRLRFILISAQVAVSLVLLTSAGLLLHSLWKRQSVSLGFDADSVKTASIVLGRQGYEQPAQRAEFFDQLLDRAVATPGASVVALADTLPPLGRVNAMIFSLIEVEGRPRASEGTGGMVPWRLVTPGFFEALRIPILLGRPFLEEDRRPGSNAVILSAALARRIFGEQDAVGKRLRLGRSADLYTVVGISGEVHNSGVEKREPEYYVARKHSHSAIAPDAPEAQRRATLIVRSPLSPQLVEQWLQKEVASLDPTIPVSVEPLSKRVSDLSARPRFQAALLALFAVLGLILSAAGLYGLITLIVSQRTREIGVRLSIGATPSQVTRMVVWQALRWCLFGVWMGLAASWFAVSLIQTMLFQTSPMQSGVWAAACGVLLAAASTAAWIPARRAGHLDPAETLRAD